MLVLDFINVGNGDSILVRERQAGHNEGASDPRPGMIAAYLDLRLPTDWARRDVAGRACYLADEEEQERLGAYQRDRVCAVEILCELFHRPVGGTSRYDVREINAIMDRMPGWVKAENSIRFSLYGKQKGYIRENQDGSEKR